MQSVSSRIWTRIVVSISCDDNHYTTGSHMFAKYGTIYKLLFLLRDPLHTFIQTAFMRTLIFIMCVKKHSDKETRPSLSLLISGFSTHNLLSLVSSIYMVPSICLQTFWYRHLILLQTLKNSVCYCYKSFEMTDQFCMISGSNQLLQQQLEYTLLKPDCHSWWISKNVIWHFRRTICNKILFYTCKKCHWNVWNASYCFSTILYESSIRGIWVAYEIQGRQGVCEG